MEYLNSLKKRSKHFTSPFEHWEMNEPLTTQLTTTQRKSSGVVQENNCSITDPLRTIEIGRPVLEWYSRV